jgi:hypothetical protein
LTADEEMEEFERAVAAYWEAVRLELERYAAAVIDKARRDSLVCPICNSCKKKKRKANK